MRGRRIAFGLVLGLVLTVWGLLGAGAALADEGHRFVSKDWELACDNTRTCRAAGYQPADDDVSLVSLLMTRAAGPDTPVHMTLSFERYLGKQRMELPLSGEKYRLRIGAMDLRNLEAGRPTELRPEQVRAMLPEMLKASVALIWVDDHGSDSPDAMLSLAGLNAVLLKMDEWQGRDGTPGALVWRGSKPESSVLPPVPMPVFKAIASAGERIDPALAKRILLPKLAEVKKDCGEDPLADYDFGGDRLTERRVLLFISCSTGPDDAFVRFWISNDKPPYAPQPLFRDTSNGYFQAGDMSFSYQGLPNDEFVCQVWKTWHFDGQKFVLTRVSNNNLCRSSVPLDLPTYVTHVIPPNSPLPPKP